jgi:putative peptide zinc metalloprotease protein
VVPGLRFHRHRYRGEAWYVVRNPSSGRVHRLTPAAHALVAWLDGTRTVQELQELALERMGDGAPTRDETVWLLGLLYLADVLRCDVPPDTAALLRRVLRERERERWGRRSPIAFRVPLLDPDAFLARFEPWLRPAFTRTGAWLWCAVVLAAGLLALGHRPELAAASGTLLEPEGLAALWLAYPLVKALHELGHAFAVKRWGGEVHELGLLFLVFVPLPYVDASAAAVLAEKHRRMAVSAAGIAVELLLAAFATFVWVVAEPGGVRTVAYAVMVLGGVSSLLFNGNPLLRFDGYHVLADALEIPNLADRARRYLGALVTRHLLGQRDAKLPDTAPGEAPWLVGYALASSAYGTAVLLGIALFLSTHFFALGVTIALATLAVRIGLPLARHAARIVTDPALGERRSRALAGSAGALALLGIALVALPLPLRTRSEGVVWLPERAEVRAGAPGFVEEVLATPHARVREGEPLIRVRDASLEARVRALEAQRREFELRRQALEGESRVRVAIERERLAEAQAALARAREQAGEVTIRAASAGVFVPVGGEDLVGRHVRQGQVVAWVVDLRDATVRVVVPQQDVALVRARTRAAWVRRASDVGEVLPARLAREVPAATDRLPTAALGRPAGGPIGVDPLDPDGVRTREPVFQFDLALPDDVALRVAGERVLVRFDHGAEPIAWRAARGVRRIFLSRLGV